MKLNENKSEEEKGSKNLLERHQERVEEVNERNLQILKKRF